LKGCKLKIWARNLDDPTPPIRSPKLLAVEEEKGINGTALSTGRRRECPYRTAVKEERKKTTELGREEKKKDKSGRPVN